MDGPGNRPDLTLNQGQGGPAYLNGMPTKLVITIYCDNSAFNGNESGREVARTLRIVSDRVDLKSKSDLIRGYQGDPKSLFDINGNWVVRRESADD